MHNALKMAKSSWPTKLHLIELIGCQQIRLDYRPRLSKFLREFSLMLNIL